MQCTLHNVAIKENQGSRLSTSEKNDKDERRGDDNVSKANVCNAHISIRKKFIAVNVRP